MTRREFVRITGCTAAGVAAGLSATVAETVEAKIKSRVVLIRHPEVVTAKGGYDQALVEQMLDRAMVALFGKDKPLDNWKEILNPDDVLGIKSNVWQHLPTPSEVESTLQKRAMEVGIPEDKIAISDRDVLNIEVFQKATALINTRPMRTHAWSGVGSLIKNYITFVTNKPDYHDDACASLARLWELPITKGKTRLNVLVMLTPQFHTVGPHHFDPSYIWNYNGLIVSADPVAADSIGLQIIQQKRKLVFGEDRPLQPTAHHIALADREYGLGQSQNENIDLIRVGWDKAILI
jgi:hypothetical protein